MRFVIQAISQPSMGFVTRLDLLDIRNRVLYVLRSFKDQVSRTAHDWKQGETNYVVKITRNFD